MESCFRSLADVGHQIVGNAVGGLAQQAALVGAHGVEVAQQHRGEVRVGRGVVRQDALDHNLGPAVGVRADADTLVLRQRQALRRTVDRGRGAEDEIPDAVSLHGLQQRQGAVQVVAVVAQRLAHRLAHGLQPGEVDDGVKMPRHEKALHGLAVRRVGLAHRQVPARNVPDALRHPAAAVQKVVQERHAVARLQQGDGGMGADVPGSACEQKLHKFPPGASRRRPRSGAVQSRIPYSRRRASRRLAVLRLSDAPPPGRPASRP